VSERYPYNARLSRWDVVSGGLVICAVALDGEPFPFLPGQYNTLGLDDPDGKTILRPMSISSPSTDLSEYEFFIRHVGEGEFTPLLWDLKVGDPLFMKGAKGKFVLQEDGKQCLFVASGTGLAPFMSMIETLLATGESREIHLLHGVSHEYDLAWREWLTEIEADHRLPLHYAGTVSRPKENPSWTGLTGRVETVVASEMDRRGLTAENTTLYLCGNPEMITAVDEIATARGFPPEQVRKELYWPKARPHGPVSPPSDDAPEEPAA
jgi:ferredoxin/flavodoxin---NADP+ reductase